MIKKNLLRSISVIMACMMAVMTVACGSNTATTETASAPVQTQEEQIIEKSIMAGSQVAASIGEAGKVETVYVTADANGAVNDVIVSEWLKNAEASTDLSDTTELKDIVNVKGSETYTQNSDGTLTWDAEGADIYYQGTTDKELPVDMKITYTLDGKEISPADLAGKSGKVTIRFEYENKAKQTVDVDGKDIEVYTPFAMVSGMMLDSDKFANVEISNGKVISDGGNYIVMGVALPGLKESLNISDDKWDELDDSKEIQDKLSNSFEITADTTDFELGMTITMASSDILSDFGVADFTDTDKIDELKDDMNELNDGSDQLVDGAQQLYDGTQQLYDGTGELYDGAGKLYDGTKELKDGTGKLADGTGKLADGAGQLVDGAGQLFDGTSTLKDGTGKLYDGTNSLYDGIVAYTEGVSKVNDGAGQLAKGTSSAKEGAKKLEGGIQQTKAGADKLSAGANEFYNQLSGIPTMLNGVTGLLTKKQEVQKEYAQYSAAYAYLTGQGGSYEECAGLLSALSGGKITSAADVEELKANFLQYITVAGATQTVSQDSNDDENEVVVSGGTLENPDVQDENKDDVTEGSQDQQTEETNTPAQSDEASSEESGDSQPAADTATETADNATETADGSEEASDEGGAETAKPDNGDKEGNVTTVNTSEEPVITDEQLAAFLATEKGKNAALMCVMSDPQLLGQILSNEQVQASLLSNDELINKMLANPDVLTKITGNQELMSQLISNPAVINSILGNTELLTSLLSKDEVMALLLSNGEVMGKIMANEQVKAMVMGSDDMKYYSSTLAGYAQMVGVTAAATKTLGELLTTLDSMPIGEDSLGKVSAAVDAAKTIAYGNASLASGLDQLYDGAKTLNEGLGQLDSGASALAKGTGTLVANSGALKDGAGQLKSGAGQLNDGAGQLRDGADKLSNGTKELKAGTDELNSGAKDLNNGAGELMDGAGQLKDGAGELNDGAQKLNDGVQELLDGICRFDEEGIKKIYEAFDGDLTEFADKMTAIQEAGSNYTSFGGASQDEKSSVKFIIKTEGVKAQDA